MKHVTHRHMGGIQTAPGFTFPATEARPTRRQVGTIRSRMGSNLKHDWMQDLGKLVFNEPDPRDVQTVISRLDARREELLEVVRAEMNGGPVQIACITASSAIEINRTALYAKKIEVPAHIYAMTDGQEVRVEGLLLEPKTVDEWVSVFNWLRSLPGVRIQLDELGQMDFLVD